MDDQKALEGQEKMEGNAIICGEGGGEKTERFRIEKWAEAETPSRRDSIGVAA